MKQLPIEKQFYYEMDGQWKAFNRPQTKLGKPKTYDDFLEATKPSESELVAQREAKAKLTRDTAINTDIEYKGVMWQVSDDAKTVRNTISDAELIGALDTDTQMWRLSDNSWRETSLAELRELLTVFITRKRDIWTAHGAWDSGDKQSEFTVE